MVLCHIIRLTLVSGPNKVGLKVSACLSVHVYVRLTTHKKFLRFQ